MIKESKKAFFTTAFIVFEDYALIDAVRNKKYDSIVGISYNNLPFSNLKTRFKKTAIIDLSKTEDEIFSGFNDTARNEIRKTFKMPELSIQVGEGSSRDTYALYKSFEYAQSRVPFKEDMLSECLFFSAYINGEIVSGMYVDRGGTYLRIRYIFSKRLSVHDKEMYKVISYATRRLIWEICVWGKKNGFISLDMASVSVKNPKTKGIAQFKMSFGGTIVDEYTYIYKSKLFSFFERLISIKIFLQRIIRR